MRLFVLFIVTLATTLVSAEHHGGSKRNHAIFGVSKRDEVGLSAFKRGDGAQFTFYKDGLGACGKTNQPYDFIVALNSQDFDGGSHCFDMITITVGDKSRQAMIVDECMGCGPGNLDFSEGLFNFFGSESEGVLHGSWSYGGDAKPSSSPSPSPTPKAKASPSPTPKPSQKPSSKAKPSSTKAKSSSSSIKHLTTLTPSATVTPNINVQTAGGLTSQEANASSIYAINMAFLGLGGLVASA